MYTGDQVKEKIFLKCVTCHMLSRGLREGKNCLELPQSAWPGKDGAYNTPSSPGPGRWAFSCPRLKGVCEDWLSRPWSVCRKQKCLGRGCSSLTPAPGRQRQTGWWVPGLSGMHNETLLFSKEEKKNRGQVKSTSTLPALSASHVEILFWFARFVVPDGEQDFCFNRDGQLHLGTRNSFKTPSQPDDGESVRYKQHKHFMRTAVCSWKNLAEYSALFCFYVLMEEGKV